MAAFDAKKLSQLDWGVAGAGGVALISLFLPWYGVSSGFYSASISGWSTSYGWLGSLLIVAAGVYLVMHRSQVNLANMPIGPAVVVLGAAILGTLIIAIRWLTLPSGSTGVVGGASFSYGPRIGIILTLIVGIVQVVCAFMIFRGSGEALPWAAKSGASAASGVPPSTYTPQQTDGAPTQSFIPPQADEVPPASDEGSPPTV